MRHLTTLIFLTTFLLSVWLTSSTPIDPHRWLINRPTPRTMFDMSEELIRHRRFPGRNGYDGSSVKGGTRRDATPQELAYNLRKGEYICGNKVCRLEPGVVPKGCPDGLCQYPIRREIP